MRKQVKEVLTEKFFEKQRELTDELQDVRREWLLKHQNQLINEIKESINQLNESMLDLEKQINTSNLSSDEFHDIIDEGIKILNLIKGESDMEKRTLVLMIERMLEKITKEKRYNHNYLR